MDKTSWTFVWCFICGPPELLMQIGWIFEKKKCHQRAFSFVTSLLQHIKWCQPLGRDFHDKNDIKLYKLLQRCYPVIQPDENYGLKLTKHFVPRNQPTSLIFLTGQQCGLIVNDVLITTMMSALRLMSLRFELFPFAFVHWKSIFTSLFNQHSRVGIDKFKSTQIFNIFPRS